VAVNRGRLRAGGVLIAPDLVDPAELANRKSHNVALLGALGAHLDLSDDAWRTAIHACLPEKLWAANEQAFAAGRRAATTPKFKP